MKILVLGGGNSPEREVSLRSAANVAAAARQAGFEVETADPKASGEALDGLKDTIVLPILHGAGGEDGSIQKQMESRGLPFLGTGSMASKNCFDKWKTRQTLESSGVRMAKAERVNKHSYANSSLYNRPHVLKILHGGSSIGTAIVRNPSYKTIKPVNELFRLENNAVIEELIEGHEITVPILDGKALPVIEIIPPTDGEFDYENKYNGRAQELCPAQNIDDELQKQAQALAEKVHSTMGARHLSRIDMMIDKAGKLYVLEINTMPGMTTGSLFPKSAQAAGISMPQLVIKLVELVKRDYSL